MDYKLLIKPTERQLSKADIEGVEKELGAMFPNDFKSFYLMYNGGRFVSDSVWLIAPSTGLLISLYRFLPMLSIDEEQNKEVLFEDEMAINDLPIWCMVFCADCHGQSICLNLLDGKIYRLNNYSWDEGLENNLDMEQNLKNSQILLAESFSAFLAMIQQGDDPPVETATRTWESIVQPKLEFLDCDKQLTKAQIDTTSKRLGITFSEELEAHYLLYNGGYPNRSVLIPTVGELAEVEVSRFLSIPESKHKALGFETCNLYVWQQGLMPCSLVGFAIDAGDNYFCQNLLDGKIYYYVFDVWEEALTNEENHKMHASLIANSFNEFVNSLVLNEEVYD